MFDTRALAAPSESMLKLAALLMRRGGRWNPHSPEHHKGPPGARCGRHKGSNAAKAGSRLARNRVKAAERERRAEKAWKIRQNGRKASAPVMFAVAA